jgi:hypothetical protein
MATRSAGNPHGKREPAAWAFVLSVFVFSRGLFLLAGALAAAYLPGAEPAGNPLEPPGTLNYWAHWDGAWYAEISTDGYAARDPASTAFFPLYPLLVKVGAFLGGPALWGVAVSCAATLFALYFLYRIAEHLFDARVARASTLCFALFPTAFYMNAVYTEALFVALTTGAIWAAMVRRNLLLAGIFGAFATATRNVGVLILLPLLLEWFEHRREFGVRGLASLTLVPAGLVAYFAYLQARFGDALISARQQEEYWGRTVTDPATTMLNAFEAAGAGLPYLLDPARLLLDRAAGPSLTASNTLNLIFFGLFVLLVGVSLLHLPPGFSLYALVGTLLPVLTPSPNFPLMSMPRFLLAAFPIFIALGLLLSRNRVSLVLWLVFSTVFGLLLTAMFVTWRWVA